MASINTGLGGPQGVGEGDVRGSTLTTGNYDDGSLAVDISSVFPEGIDYFGTSYTTIYINTNGLITFAAPNTNYVPSPISDLNNPSIALFWTDVNITTGTAGGTNNIYYDLDPASGDVTITWLDVKPYQNNGPTGPTNTFQLVMHSTGSGNFELEFIYEDVDWTTAPGSAPAQTGFTDGGGSGDGGVNDFVIPGSGNSAALLNFPTTVLQAGDPPGTYSQAFWNGIPVCFVDGTLISTPSGPRAVETLQIGDLVDTLDHGPQPLRWVGGWSSLVARAALPICIAPGALGNNRELRVSGQHLMMLSGLDCEMLFGEAEVLVAAKDLVGLPGVRLADKPGVIGYHHLMLDRHQILLAEGAPTESLHPGPMTMEKLPTRQRELLEGAFAAEELAAMAKQPAARRVLRGFEAKVLRNQRLGQGADSAAAA